MRMIHVWAQSYEANPGGIQIFSRFAAQTLRQLYPTAELVILAKNDGRSTAPLEVGSQQSFVTGRPISARVVGFGCWPSKLRAIAFALSALGRAWGGGTDLLIFSTHANFARLGWLVKKMSRARVIVVGHGIDVWAIGSAAQKHAQRAVDQLVAVSDFTRRRWAEQLGISADAIALLPNTFEEERFRPAVKSPALLQQYGLSNEHLILLSVCRLEATEQYKGYDNVIKALPRVRARFPNTRYLIVGDGPDRLRAEALARETGMQEAVIFAGYAPNEQLAEHYNLCDVFAMPSKGEGFGIVFLEALGCGKPVIAGNKDGSVEPLLNGKLGKLVDPDSVEQIAEAVCETLSEVTSQTSEVGRDQAARLRAEVIAAFGYEQFKNRLRAIVEKVLEH